jgi:hypothetical protein
MTIKKANMIVEEGYTTISVMKVSVEGFCNLLYAPCFWWN